MPPRERERVIVLAAGRGTRMGVPKALMPTPRGVWWRVQAARLREAGAEATWVVSEDVRSLMGREPDAPEGMVVASSAAPMFASVVAGLRSIAGDGSRHVLVLPVDTPVPLAAVWRSLAAECAGGVSVPVFQGKRGHPICLSGPFVADVLRMCDAEPGAEERLRLDELMVGRCVEVAVADAAVAINLNTPDDVRRYFAAGGGVPARNVRSEAT